jgi:hypothetical protein
MDEWGSYEPCFQKRNYPVRLVPGIVRFGNPLGIQRLTIPPWAEDIEDIQGILYAEWRATQKKMLPTDTDTNASSGAIMKGGSASLFYHLT